MLNDGVSPAGVAWCGVGWVGEGKWKGCRWPEHAGPSLPTTAKLRDEPVQQQSACASWPLMAAPSHLPISAASSPSSCPPSALPPASVASLTSLARPRHHPRAWSCHLPRPAPCTPMLAQPAPSSLPPCPTPAPWTPLGTHSSAPGPAPTVRPAAASAWSPHRLQSSPAALPKRSRLPPHQPTLLPAPARRSRQQHPPAPQPLRPPLSHLLPSASLCQSPRQTSLLPPPRSLCPLPPLTPHRSLHLPIPPPSLRAIVSTLHPLPSHVLLSW